MRKSTTTNGLPIFDANRGDHLSYHQQGGPATVAWNFALELKRVEVQ